MVDAGMRTTLAQRLVSIGSYVLDQTCFNYRLATHFNISTFGHIVFGRQTFIVCPGPKIEARPTLGP